MFSYFPGVIPLGECFSNFCKVEFFDHSPFLTVKTKTFVKIPVNTPAFGKRGLISMTITGVQQNFERGRSLN